MTSTPSWRARMRPALAAAACVCAATLALPAAADVAGGPFITTWAASPLPVWGADFLGPVNMPRALRNQTIREIARVSVGGGRVRVVLTNEFGDRPLVVGSAHVALFDNGPAIAQGSDRKLTFGGRDGITIPPGAPAVSDPVDLAVPALGSLAISLFFPQITPTTTWHQEGVQTAYISDADGDHTADHDFKPATTTLARLFLSEVQVEAPAGAKAIVTFGDSITDGAVSTVDANHRWPDYLAERLHQAGQSVAVINQGISGDRVLRDRMGTNALARFDRDVLTQPHATAVVLMMGINDIGWPDTILVPTGEPAPAPEDVIAGYKQLITRAHDHGLRIYGATLTPFQGALDQTPIVGYYTEAKEVKRQAINQWIRTSGAFDGVIDFDAATRDPANPKHIRADYDSGDHLHPGDGGYKAMADVVDLKTLVGN